MRSSTASTCTKIAAELALVALLTGCAVRDGLSVREPRPAGSAAGGSQSAGAATSPSDIDVLADVNEISRPYRMVGYVEAERLGGPGESRVSVKDLLPVLRERAGRMGAQALIELETHPLRKEGRQGLRATAIAIVFTD